MGTTTNDRSNERSTMDRTRTNDEHAPVNSPATFDRPIQASLDGQPVKILALGDIEGRSPGFLYVDQNGYAKWEGVREFVVIDPNYLPTSEDALRRATRTLSR